MIRIKIKSKLNEAPHADFSPIREIVEEKTGKIIKLPEKVMVIDDFIDFCLETQPQIKGGDFSAKFDTTDGESVYVDFNKYGDPKDASLEPFKTPQLSEDWMEKGWDHYHQQKEAKSGNWYSEREIPPPGRGMEESLTEKKDRCYHQAKRKYKVFPSAYASGYIVRCRKGKVGRKKKKEE